MREKRLRAILRLDIQLESQHITRRAPVCFRQKTLPLRDHRQDPIERTRITKSLVARESIEWGLPV